MEPVVPIAVLSGTYPLNDPDGDEHDDEHIEDEEAWIAQAREDLPTFSRNEPCPCGSGKKYKKCCGR